MSQISDLILAGVKNAAGNVEIPSNVKNSVLSGMSDSILGSLTQTVTKAGGVDQIKGLLSGKADAATSPVTALAGNLFKNNVLKSLNLGASQSNAISGLIPVVMGKLGGILKDQDGDGDVDFNDIILTLKGGNGAKSSGAGLLGAATSILGGLLKKK